ncbi:MAG: bacteriophage holin [Hyphomicrobiales bacterium]
MARNRHHSTLGVISLGLALGLSWAISVFLLAVIAAAFGWGVNVAVALQSLYVGYGPTFVGAITGTVWAFVHGVIGGVMIAWFYNRFLLVRQHPFHAETQKHQTHGPAPSGGPPAEQ